MENGSPLKFEPPLIPGRGERSKSKRKGRGEAREKKGGGRKVARCYAKIIDGAGYNTRFKTKIPPRKVPSLNVEGGP